MGLIGIVKCKNYLLKIGERHVLLYLVGQQTKCYMRMEKAYHVNRFTLKVARKTTTKIKSGPYNANNSETRASDA